MDEKERYESLAYAIIAQAVDDYRKAIKGRDKWEILSLERFFQSGWFITLSAGADPDYILEEVLSWRDDPKRMGRRQYVSILQFDKGR